MNIEEKNIVVLDDDSKYAVVKKLNMNNKNYYYVVDITNNQNVRFFYEDGNELVEVEYVEELEDVIRNMFKTIDVDDFLEELSNKLKEKNKFNEYFH